MFTIGVDLVHIPTFKKTRSEVPNFVKSVFFADEITEQIDSLAGIFAAKEAIRKATDVKIVSWQDIRIIKKENGKPVIDLLLLKEKMPMIESVSLSNSHHHHYAIATALVFWQDNKQPE